MVESLKLQKVGQKKIKNTSQTKYKCGISLYNYNRWYEGMLL